MTHRGSRLGWVGLTKSPSCNCRGCSQCACLPSQTCGGRCRHMLYQTAEQDKDEREKERDCEFEGEDSKACKKRGRNGGEVVGETKTLSYIKWVVAGCFPLWNIELLAGTCCSSVAKPQTAVTGLWIMWLLSLSFPSPISISLSTHKSRVSEASPSNQIKQINACKGKPFCWRATTSSRNIK